jgi:hypothetical protein
LKTYAELASIAWDQNLSKESKKWIKKHEEADARRLASEKKERKRKRIKKRALSKLTPKERKVLGLA